MHSCLPSSFVTAMVFPFVSCSAGVALFVTGNRRQPSLLLLKNTFRKDVFLGRFFSDFFR